MVLVLAIPAQASLHDIPDLADRGQREVEMSVVGENLLDRSDPDSALRRAGQNPNELFSSS